VIPTYNRATLVGRAIESALNQLRPPDEVVVVNDGSSDDTSRVIEGYGNRVTLVDQPRRGVSSARNVGVRRARSDYVAFLDSDDVWEPSHLLRMERAIEATNGEAVLYFSDALSGDSRYAGLTFWELHGFEIEGAHETRSNGEDWLFNPFQPIINPSVALIKRDTYLAVGGSEPRLARRGDTHLFFKIGMAGPVCAVAGAAATVTQDDPSSITRTFPPGDITYLDCTVWLYDDLLRRHEFRPAQRRVLKRRLADGYWELAKHRGARTPIERLDNLRLAVRNYPGLLPTRLIGRMRRSKIGGSRRSAASVG
jgi:glycosyltransferase involved in cell wall biosynthesis